MRQLEHGVIVDLFERRFSADGAKHQPSRQAYAYVERELGVAPSQLCLIACHTWDTLGAVAAGWEAALIRRVGNDVLGVGPSHRSSATTSMTSPISSSPGTTPAVNQPREPCMSAIAYRKVNVDGLNIFYREAGAETRQSCCSSTVFRARATCSAT